MQPDTLRFGSKLGTKLGERNLSNTYLHGRGIERFGGGNILIGYWDDGDYSPGPYIRICSEGTFRVGMLYMKDGERWKRGMQYNTDGTEEPYDQPWFR